MRTAELVLAILVGICVFHSPYAYPHGENKPGPHQGYIRMPGGFHTELLVLNGALKVYLLDVEFKNPVVKRSSVSGIYKITDKKVEFECAPNEDFFHCKLPREINLEHGEIALKTTRLGMPAGLAVYRLPLSLKVAH